MSSPEGKLSRAAVIGGGAFGTALAHILATKGAQTLVWVRDGIQAEMVNRTRVNEKYLPSYTLHPLITFCSSVEEAVKDAEIILFAVPTPYLRPLLTEHRGTWPRVPLVQCAKGIEVSTLATPFEAMLEELPGKYHRYIAVLAGPSFAKEMVAGMLTQMCVAAIDEQVAMSVQAMVSSRIANVRCYAGNDVMGCEIAGAVKNVLAIASGASQGLGLGNNARAALICRGLREMSLLAAKMGSSAQAINGLAGIGDLVLTCSSELSRNFTVGLRLAKGDTLDDVINTKSVAEGVETAKSLHSLRAKLNLELPICEEVYLVLHEGKPVRKALEDLLNRPLSAEQ